MGVQGDFDEGDFLDPFLVLEIKVGKTRPEVLAHDISHGPRTEEGIELQFGLLFAPGDAPAPWRRDEVAAWAKEYVDRHGETLAFMIDEKALLVKGWPALNMPVVGRRRLLGLAGLGRFEPRDKTNPDPDRVTLVMTSEGNAFLQALEGRSVPMSERIS